MRRENDGGEHDGGERDGRIITRATHGYPSGTHGYRSQEGAAPEQIGGGSRGDGGSAEPPDEAPFWRRLGFDSHRHYLEWLEDDQDRLDRKFWPWKYREPPAGSLPGDEIRDVGVVRRRQPVRQVGIKLRPADYEALASAAFLYGVRPTTMARMLVNRGARAVLEARDG
jgi:hypothetical protein